MKRSSKILGWLLILFAAAAQAGDTFESTELQGLGAKESGVTLSGLSAGAYFAVQFHLAYADIVSGSATIAGGSYWCAQGNAQVAYRKCMKGSVPVEVSLERYALEEARGRVAARSELQGDRAFVFSGQNDILVAHKAVSDLEEFYRKLLGADAVSARYDSPAGHGLPTLGYGKPCSERDYFNSPWLLDCDLDGAGMLLTALLDDLSDPHAPWSVARSGKLYTFDQRPFIAGRGSSLASYGHVFIPDTCYGGGCRIHVALHGCDQDPATVGNSFVLKGGYNEWALANNLIILYPAARKNFFAPQNPLGCFDWWGYTGSNYHVRDGVQMRAVRAMIQALGN